MAGVAEYGRTLAWIQVQQAGGLGTVAGLKLAYLRGLIDVNEFVERMDRLSVPAHL